MATELSASARGGARPILDLLVVGSGVAGLSAAVQAAEAGLQVGVVTKGTLTATTTWWAQGGVAAALSRDPEETDLHLADTLAAGVGLCDPDAVRVLVDEGPARVEELIALGAVFDRDAEGRLELAREGGHSVPRVIHAGGAATGREIERALVAAVSERAMLCAEHTFALDLLVEDGRCVGLTVLGRDGAVAELRARNTLLATGGAGQLYAITTNPAVATGDGVAMALRAGVAVADLEFFQFHPTALHHPAIPRPLLSEALRGHGALLRDARGDRFVDELLPRDVVSRAMTARMLDQGVDHLWLDATGLEQFEVRFPTIDADIRAIGLDPAKDWLPVAPAAHHQCGGIVTDLRGATTLPGLWAAGETSCSGVHGANRLASNSLLEGMVFGPRVVEAILGGVDGPEPSGAMRCVFRPTEGPILGRSIGPAPVIPPPSGDARIAAAEARAGVQFVMSAGAGMFRNAATLEETVKRISGLLASVPDDDAASMEVRNLATVGLAVCRAAAAREESRGCHAREDFPDRDDERLHRIVQST